MDVDGHSLCSYKKSYTCFGGVRGEGGEVTAVDPALHALPWGGGSISTLHGPLSQETRRGHRTAPIPLRRAGIRVALMQLQQRNEGVGGGGGDEEANEVCPTDDRHSV